MAEIKLIDFLRAELNSFSGEEISIEDCSRITIRLWNMSNSNFQLCSEAINNLKSKTYLDTIALIVTYNEDIRNKVEAIASKIIADNLENKVKINCISTKSIIYESILNIIELPPINYLNLDNINLEYKLCYLKQIFKNNKILTDIFIKNIIGFLFLNLNEKNVEKLVNILTFTKKTVSNEIIEDITLIFENCKFINKIHELMPFYNYDIIINKMKNFKHNNCDLCLLLSELFKTSSNINEFLDIFKNEFKEDINTNYLLKGDYSNRKFTIFRWHVNDKYNQWDYLFKNIVQIFEESVCINIILKEI